MNRRTTTTTQQQQASTTFSSVESTAGVSFAKGNMVVNGSPQIPIFVQDWFSSNGLTKYTTVLWQDPATGERRVSCNCLGWTHRRVNAARECCHTKDMKGIEPCGKQKADAAPVPITSMQQAEERIKHFDSHLDGRELRAINLTPRK